jgi:hypothetical protein
MLKYRGTILQLTVNIMKKEGKCMEDEEKTEKG